MQFDLGEFNVTQDFGTSLVTNLAPEAVAETDTTNHHVEISLDWNRTDADGTTKQGDWAKFISFKMNGENLTDTASDDLAFTCNSLYWYNGNFMSTVYSSVFDSTEPSTASLASGGAVGNATVKTSGSYAAQDFNLRNGITDSNGKTTKTIASEYARYFISCFYGGDNDTAKGPQAGDLASQEAALLSAVETVGDRGSGDATTAFNGGGALAQAINTLLVAQSGETDRAATNLGYSVLTKMMNDTSDANRQRVLYEVEKARSAHSGAAASARTGKNIIYSPLQHSGADITVADSNDATNIANLTAAQKAQRVFIPFMHNDTISFSIKLQHDDVDGLNVTGTTDNAVPDRVYKITLRLVDNAADSNGDLDDVVIDYKTD